MDEEIIIDSADQRQLGQHRLQRYRKTWRSPPSSLMPIDQLD
jgi:hypothetical protein